MKPSERIGENAQDAREWRGLSRAALGARCKLTEIERGEIEQKASDLIKIEAVLAISPGSLQKGVSWDQRRLRFEVEPTRDDC